MSLLLDALKKAALEKQHRDRLHNAQLINDDSVDVFIDKVSDDLHYNQEFQAITESDTTGEQDEQNLGANDPLSLDVDFEALQQDATVAPELADGDLLANDFQLEPMARDVDASYKSEDDDEPEVNYASNGYHESAFDDKPHASDQSLTDNEFNADYESGNEILTEASAAVAEIYSAPAAANHYVAPAISIPSASQQQRATDSAGAEQQARKNALKQLLATSQQAAAKQQRRKLVLLGGLFFTSAILVAVYYYYLVAGDAVHQTLVYSNNPSQPAVEAIATTEDDFQVVDAVDPSSATAAIETELQSSEDTSPPNTSPANNDTASGVTPSLTSTNAQTPADTAAAKSVNIVAARSAIATAPSQQSLNNNTATPIVQKNAASPTQLSLAINQGYSAYQRGDINAAATAYQRALEISPHHRDALLGAAAVALQQSRRADALRFYQQRLARAPRDDYAHAGILALISAQQSSPELESEVNLLLKEFPTAAHLHFLQGSLLASRNAWSAAQSAFFEAFRFDSTKPDYAFNLAIALDHINQPAEALRYYQQALGLAQQNPAAFSVAAVQQRIAELEAQQR